MKANLDKELIKLMKKVVDAAPAMENVVNRACLLLEDMGANGINKVALCNHDYEISQKNIRFIDFGGHAPAKCIRCGHHAYLHKITRKK